MAKRLTLVIITMLFAVAALLIAAGHPTGPDDVSYDDPAGLWLSLGMLVALFVVPIVLSLFEHRAVKVISAVYQAIMILTYFVGLIPVGLIAPGSIWVGIIGLIGAIVSISSMIVTIKTDETGNSSSHS